LPEELENDGLVVTDALELRAIGKHCSLEEAVRRAVLAREDMVLICAKPDLVRRGHAALLASARNGEISMERIHASLRRIAHYKEMTLAPPTLIFIASESFRRKWLT
ncbi:MAG: glycoside hydrolase family 3 N-terminal domain-containing protein, partial [Pyrinomonadaceae bacterium]